MIELKHVTKRYGAKCAVNDISFTINKGEVLGFLGRNGAGKSTTMNMITGYISASEGQILIDGMDILEQPREAKRRIGYLPELPPLYMDMTVEEYLKFVCEIKEVRRKSQKAHLDDLYNLVKITDVRHRLIRNLSKGYKQRVVLSSHILHEVADVCDRVVIINKGQIVAQDTLANLTHGIGESIRLTVRIIGPEKPVTRMLREIPGVKYVETLGSREADSVDYLVESDSKTDVRRPLVNAVLAGGYSLLMLKPMDVTLEDIFLQLTSEDKGGI